MYVDNDRSAWKADGKREAWDAMIAAGRRSEFAGLLAYKLDRFSRNLRDAEDLVDLAGKRRVIVDGPNSGRIDLSTAEGRQRFRQAACRPPPSPTTRTSGSATRLPSGRGRAAAGSGRLYGFKVLSGEREEDDDVDARMSPPRQR